MECLVLLVLLNGAAAMAAVRALLLRRDTGLAIASLFFHASSCIVWAYAVVDDRLRPSPMMGLGFLVVLPFAVSSFVTALAMDFALLRHGAAYSSRAPDRAPAVVSGPSSTAPGQAAAVRAALSLGMGCVSLAAVLLVSTRTSMFLAIVLTAAIALVLGVSSLSSPSRGLAIAGTAVSATGLAVAVTFMIMALILTP